MNRDSKKDDGDVPRSDLREYVVVAAGRGPGMNPFVGNSRR